MLKGIHHVTAMTSSAEKIYEFFTYTLGIRLVKKTVNQDDIRTYHLFFADDKGNPGTDMTFFDFPNNPPGTHGTNELRRTAFRVPTDDALLYWKERFTRLNVIHEDISVQFGKKVLNFYDFDNQHYQLISDQNNKGIASGTPWQLGPIPLHYAITGLGPITIAVANMDTFSTILQNVFKMKQIAQEDNAYLFTMGQGGNGAQVVVIHEPSAPVGHQGYGAIHHVAFRVNTKEELLAWQEHLEGFGYSTSGFVDRFFFGALYVRATRHLLFELSTDGPGFMGDEPYETLGEKLSLPPFLEAKRSEIESMVRPIDTVRSTKTFEKQ